MSDKSLHERVERVETAIMEGNDGLKKLRKELLAEVKREDTEEGEERTD